MEALFIVVGAIVLLYITGLLGTVRKSLAVADKSLDTFNTVASGKLEVMELSSAYDDRRAMGKLKEKLADKSKPTATAAEIRKLLKMSAVSTEDE